MVGMILGSPAQVAGVEQGDQLLQIDSMQVDGQSPFQAASAISGSDAEPDAVPEPIVHLQVHASPDWCCDRTLQDLIAYALHLGLSSHTAKTL